MKTIVCEMCGSHDVVKQDGMYVCQNCATKYSVEEAKKLFAEVESSNGEVIHDTESPIRVDDQSVLNQLLESADRFYESRDYVHAGALYEKIIELDPTNWRGVFYSLCCNAYQSRIMDIPQHLSNLQNTAMLIPPMITENFLSNENLIRENLLEYQTNWFSVNKCLIANLRSMWKEHGNDYKRNYQIGLLESYATQLLLIKNWLTNPEMEGWSNEPSFRKPIINLVVSIYEEIHQYFMDFSNANIDYLFDKNTLYGLWNPLSNNMFYTELKPHILKEIPSYINPTEKRIMDRIAYLKANPNAEQEAIKAAKKTSGGCYVATAVYGSYDCPEVWTLRRFRDNTLAETWYGRAFILVYYAISPTLVKWFGKTEWFKNLWKPTLDRMVENLNESGVEDTPYDDRAW